MQDESKLLDLFSTRRHARAGLDMVLSGRCGDARSNDKSAVVVAGPFVYVAGEPDEMYASDLKAGQIVMGPPSDWIPLLTALFPSSTSVSRQLFDASHLTSSFIVGLMTGFDIRRLDSELARRLVLEVHSDLILFAEQFDKDGMGFCAMVNGKLVAGATGALWSDTELEIQVNTAPAYQRRGFAAAVSAALITECLSRNIKPSWETEDATSARLAERLGYVKNGTYEWLVLK